MFSRGNRRSGFTLPEVLVTVAIVAVLAAMIVPAVTQQVSRADAPSFLGTVNGLRTAVASFAADTRKLPGELSQLSTAITTSDTYLARTRDSVGGEYSNTYTARWRGPYESSGAAAGAMLLGYGWTAEDDLVDSNTTSPTTGYLVVTLTKTGAEIPDAEELDEAVDGGNGADAGIIRWTPGTPPALAAANKIKLFLTSSAR